MRMKLRRDWIEIIPENEEDEVYIEHVLGEHPVVERVNAAGLSKLALLRIRKATVKKAEPPEPVVDDFMKELVSNTERS